MKADLTLRARAFVPLLWSPSRIAELDSIVTAAGEALRDENTWRVARREQLLLGPCALFSFAWVRAGEHLKPSLLAWLHDLGQDRAPN